MYHRSEDVSTGCIFSDAVAIGGGKTSADIFVGRDSVVIDTQDDIRSCSAATQLVNDSTSLGT